MTIQSTPDNSSLCTDVPPTSEQIGIFSEGGGTSVHRLDNSNLQGKSKKVRVIGSSEKIAESKVKNSFYYTVNMLITFKL